MLLEAYDEWVQTASSYWGCSITLSSRTLRGRLTKLSPWPGNIKSELKPFYYLQTLYPSVVNIQFANHSSVGASIVPDWPHMRGYRAGAFIPPEKHNERLWDFLVQEIMNASKGENYCHIIRLGGKTSEYDKASSSVHAGFRRAQSLLACIFAAPVSQEIGSLEEMERQKMNVAQFAEKLRKFGDGDYLNTDYTPSPDWKLDFWGAHYVDLLMVKIKYDPDNLFSCCHCVGSDKTDFDDMFEFSRASANVTDHFSTFLLLLISILIYDSRPY